MSSPPAADPRLEVAVPAGAASSPAIAAMTPIVATASPMPIPRGGAAHLRAVSDALPAPSWLQELRSTVPRVGGAQRELKWEAQLKSEESGTVAPGAGSGAGADSDLDLTRRDTNESFDDDDLTQQALDGNGLEDPELVAVADVAAHHLQGGCAGAGVSPPPLPGAGEGAGRGSGVGMEGEDEDEEEAMLATPKRRPSVAREPAFFEPSPTSELPTPVLPDAPPPPGKSRTGAKRFFARVKSALQRTNPNVELLLSARDALIEYDGVLRKELKRREGAARALASRREYLRLEGYAKLRTLYQRGLFYFIPIYKRWAIRVRNYTKAQESLVMAAVTALTARLHETAALLQAVQSNTVQEKRASRAQATEAMAATARDYKDFCKPVTEVVSHDLGVARAVEVVQHHGQLLKDSQNQLQSLKRHTKLVAYDKRRERLMLALQHEATRPSAPVCLRASSSALDRHRSDSIQLGDGPMTADADEAGAARAAVKSAVEAGSSHKPHNLPPSRRPVASALPGGRGAGRGSSVGRAASRLDIMGSLCCDCRLPEGRLLPNWCYTILGPAARIHEMEMIKFGGDTVKVLLAQDDKGMLPKRDATGRKSRINPRMKLRSGLAAGDVAKSIASGVAIEPPQKQSAMELLEAASVKQNDLSGVPVSPAAASGEGKGVLGSSTRQMAGRQLPTPGFILYFIRYLARTMMVVYDIEDRKLNKPMRSLVDRLVYPRVKRLCLAFHRANTARWDMLFRQNVAEVRLMSPIDIGVEPEYCRYNPGFDGPPGDDDGSKPRLMYQRATKLLGELPNLDVPDDMVRVLLAAVRSMLDEAGGRAGDPTVKNKMDAETMFPILVYMSCHATWRKPNRCLAYLTEFGIPAKKRGGVEDYYVTALAAAVAWICRRSLMPESSKKKAAIDQSFTGPDASLPESKAAKDGDEVWDDATSEEESDEEFAKYLPAILAPDAEAGKSVHQSMALQPADASAERDRTGDAAQVQELEKWLGQQVQEEDTWDSIM